MPRPSGRPSDAWSLARQAGPAPMPAAECPARHCWVRDPADAARIRRPGLLLEWRRTSAGWQGRVAYAAQLRDESWALVEEWVPATALARA